MCVCVPHDTCTQLAEGPASLELKWPRGSETPATIETEAASVAVTVVVVVVATFVAILSEFVLQSASFCCCCSFLWLPATTYDDFN